MKWNIFMDYINIEMPGTHIQMHTHTSSTSLHTPVCVHLKALDLDSTDGKWAWRVIDGCKPHLCSIDEGQEEAAGAPGTSLQVLETHIYCTRKTFLLYLFFF